MADHMVLDPATSLRISMGVAPEADRTGALQDLYSHPVVQRVFLPHRFEPAAEAPLRLEAIMHAWPGLGIADVRSSSARFIRTRGEAVSDDLMFSITLAGQRATSHCGREALSGDGGAVLLSGAESVFAQVSETRFLSLRVPVKPIADRLPDVADRLARPLPQDAAPLRLLTSYARALCEPRPMSRALEHAAAVHAYDLIALALGAVGDAAEAARARGVRAARLHAIKQDIESQLDRPDLSPAAVAERHRLAPRYLQRLFEADGTTCRDFINDRRLARAYQLLVDPRRASLPVSTIAFAAGFQHISRFNRAFRRRFGAAPSDVRAQARSVN